MIRITTAGTVGIKVNGRMVAKTREDAPFGTDEKVEKELVALGVAEYADGGAEEPGAADGITIDGMNKKELYDMAKGMGLEVGGFKSTTVDGLKAAIRAAMEAEDAAEEPEEADPGTEEAENGSDDAENGPDDAGTADSGEDGGDEGEGPAEEPPEIEAEGVVE